MDQKQYIVAIEIGSSKVVGAAAQVNDSRITVNHYEEEMHSNCVNYGWVQNVENIKSCINRILRRLENALDGDITHIYVGRSGRTLHSESSEVNRSIDASTAITSATIESIKRDACRTSLKRYETIEVVPRAFYVDKSLITDNNPVGHYGSSIKVKLNLIVANSSMLLNLDRVVKGFNSKPIVTALAMGNHVLSTEEKRKGCMLVDMGAETTTVSIYKNGMLVYLNTLPLGGRNLTLDIANSIPGVLEETAENVKKNINNPLEVPHTDSVVIEGVNSRDAANYISARVGEIIANINKQLEYAGVTASEMSCIVLAGGAAQLKGIAKMLEENTKIATHKATLPANIYLNNALANAHKDINVQLMAIIAEACQVMDKMDSCVKFREIVDIDIHGPRIQQEPVEKEPEEKPEKSKKKKKPSMWETLQSKFSNILTNPDDDDDDDEY